MAIIHGLGGPKAMAKAAADGLLVNIPTLPFLSTGGRSAVGQASQWFGVRGLRMAFWQIQVSAFDGEFKDSGESKHLLW